MSSPPYVTRFAPSPTGALHLGNARTALFNDLAARASGGRLVLRIEDTDAERSEEGLLLQLLADLRWLGLEWAEGPDVGGPHAPYRQSERAGNYARAVAMLEAQGRVYPCFCSPEELKLSRRAQLAAGRPPRYAGTCAALSTDEVARRKGTGARPALRFRVPAGRKVEFRDLIHGEQRFASDDIGDFVILRADGTVAFFLGNALDDADMGITLVLRGDDHLANTPRQILLLEALGRPAPQYGHLPLILGASGAPLSKREGAASLHDLRSQGYLPGALRNYLVRLGHACGHDGWLESDEMPRYFDLARSSRSAAHFDEAQLRHWQREALVRASEAELLEWLGNRVAPLGEGARQAAFVTAVRGNLLFPPDVEPLVRIVCERDVAPDETATREIAAAGPAFFEQAAAAWQTHGPDFKGWTRAVSAATGRKGAALFMPLRAALTGSTHGPELAPLTTLMGPSGSVNEFSRLARVPQRPDPNGIEANRRMLQIHNSLTGRKETFQPLTPGEVRMYVCGITVYDYCHLGHARMLIVFDVVRRHLAASGYRVTFVRNITDIDDKIIQRAQQNGEPMAALTERFIRAYHDDCEALGVAPADHEPRATEYVPQIVAMVQTLIDKGYAYVGGNGDVYYAVARFEPYGQLSGKRLADLRAGARIEVDEAKRDPLDFVLWKAAKPGEPAWESPWGPGRPGWHIECSAMSVELLGSHFDIHGGGMDLKFPHHENEIAQTCAACGSKFVNIWMHNGFVRVDDEKMSKSLGNFFTVREVLEWVRDPEVVRYFMVGSHYRGPINYTPDSLTQADTALERLYLALRGVSPAMPAPVTAATERFVAAMDDDFNTSIAVAELQSLARELNTAKAAGRRDEAAGIAGELTALGSRLDLLGLEPEVFLRKRPAKMPGQPGESATPASDGLSDGEIERLIEARAAARSARDFKESDRIRDELAAGGVLLEDQPGGKTLWRRGK